MKLSNHTAIRLSPADTKILKALEGRLGLKKAALIRLAIRRLAELERVA